MSTSFDLFSSDLCDNPRLQLVYVSFLNDCETLLQQWLDTGKNSSRYMPIITNIHWMILRVSAIIFISLATISYAQATILLCQTLQNVSEIRSCKVAALKHLLTSPNPNPLKKYIKKLRVCFKKNKRIRSFPIFTLAR